MTDANRPKNVDELKIHISADDWESAKTELLNTAEHVAEHGPTCSLVGGGGACSVLVDIKHNPEQTRERFIQELHEYVENRWGRNPKAVSDGG